MAKCSICGSEVNDGTTCSICGGHVSYTKQKDTVVYTSNDGQTTYTRSRTIALICACMAINDLYLGEWKRFITKMLLSLVTFGVGGMIWQASDIISSAIGKIKYDAYGNPIEW